MKTCRGFSSPHLSAATRRDWWLLAPVAAGQTRNPRETGTEFRGVTEKLRYPLVN